MADRHRLADRAFLAPRASDALALAVLALGVVLSGAGPMNGDAAVYADQARDGDLTSRWTHIGYVALLMTFRAIVDPGVAADLLSACACALAVAVVGRGGAGFAGARLVAVVVLVAAPFGEVDPVWFALLALGVGLADARGAGVALAAAVSVSPTALVALPWGLAVRPDGRWVGMLASVGLLSLGSGGAWWWGARGVLTGGWVPDPLAHLPGLVVPILLALPGWAAGGRARWALPIAALGLLAPADVPGGWVFALALAPYAGHAAERPSWSRPLAVVAVLGGIQACWVANVMKERIFRENEVIAQTVSAMGSRDAVIAPWSWGVRVAIARTGDPYGMPWTSPPPRPGSDFCRLAHERVAWLPPGSGPGGLHDGRTDSNGVIWMDGSHPAATLGCW